MSSGGLEVCFEVNGVNNRATAVIYSIAWCGVYGSCGGARLVCGWRYHVKVEWRERWTRAVKDSVDVGGAWLRGVGDSVPCPSLELDPYP